MDLPAGARNTARWVSTYETFLHVKGKLIFLYVNGGDQDLDWTRQFSKAWAAVILTANPSDAATVARESARRGFDWSRVLRSALIGGAVGGLFGLFRVFTRKKADK